MSFLAWWYMPPYMGLCLNEVGWKGSKRHAGSIGRAVADQDAWPATADDRL